MVEKKKAMIISVSEYDKGLHSLDFCENDGRGMFDILSSLRYEIDDEHVMIGHVDGYPMRDAILSFFGDTTIRSNDVVLFYYSGHGVPDHNTVYLTSSDTDPSFPNRRGFSVDELRVNMNSCTSTKVVSMLDSCYSGAARLGKGPSDAAKLATQLISKGMQIQEEGKYILSASQSFQEAFKSPEGNQSVFTHFLIKGLGGDKDALDIKGNVTPDTLGKYVYDKVTSVYPDQKPQKKVEASGDVILAKYSKTQPQLSPIDINVTLKEANNLFTIGEYSQAIDTYKLVLRNDLQNIQAWNNMGKAWEKSVMYEEALNCFDNAIKIDVKDYVTWYNKGNVLTKLGRFEDAHTCYNSAINLNRKDPSCWKNKAYVLSKLGREEEARMCLNTATSLSNKTPL